MAEELHIPTSADKQTRYQELLPQIEGLIEDEPDMVANMANVAAALKQVFGFLWVGFYFVKEEQLVLGPFQGPVACTRIDKGKGVCGTAWANKEIIIVEDVNEFPGHIACSPDSRSEIAVPVMNSGVCLGILDVDSEQPDHFDDTDAQYLLRIAERLVT